MNEVCLAKSDGIHAYAVCSKEFIIVNRYADSMVSRIATKGWKDK